MKAIKIYNSFSKIQQASFALFLDSPFFKVPEEVRSLFQLISQLREEESESILDQLYNLYCDRHEKINRQQFNKLSWKLRELIDQFLAHHELQNEDHLKSQLLLKAYESNDLPEQYKNIHKSAVKKLQTAALRDENYYRMISKLDLDWYYYPTSSKENQLSNQLIRNAQQNFDRHYILSKLKICAELLSREQVLNESFETPLLEEVIAMAKKVKRPEFDIYLGVINLLKDGHQDKVFYKLRRNLEQHIFLFDKYTQATLTQFLINHANRIFNSGRTAYLKQLFELYQFVVQHKLLIEHNKRINDTSFTNVVITACLYKQFDYACHFLETHKKYLQPAIARNATNLSWAYIYFHSGKFENAWTQLNKTDFVTTTYKMRARSLLIRCYYERLGSDESLKKIIIANLRSFKKFLLQLSTVSERVKMLYLHQITVVQSLTNFDKEFNNKATFRKKWLRFLDENSVMAKKWLEVKVRQL